jgi:protocatechuate 3,4-dioxygenase beta subunit
VSTRRAALPLLMIFALAACDGTTASSGSGPTASTRQPLPATTSPEATITTPPAAARGCERPAAGTAAAGSQVIPGPSNGLRRSNARGETLVIEAVVLTRDCRPATGAGVHLWHTDAHGLYGPAGSEGCCYYDGTVSTDAAGRFRIRTIRPAQYPVPAAPPAHIHLEIIHSEGRLETEIVFVGTAPTGPLGPTDHELAVPLRRSGGAWHGDAVLILT